MKKIISILTIIIFVCQNAAFGISIDRRSATLRPPSHFSEVTERFIKQRQQEGTHQLIDRDFIVNKRIKKAVIIVPFPYKEIPYSERARNYLPLGAGYICASLKQELAPENVEFLDLSVVKDDFDFKAYLAEHNFDLIGFSISADAILNNAYELAIQAKEVLPDVLICAGGIPPSSKPKTVIDDSRNTIDICVHSEGEEIIVNLVQACNEGRSLKGLDGIAVVNSYGDYYFKKSKKLPDINKLSHPPWDFIDISAYNLETSYMQGQKVVNTSSGRGCPYGCAFCGYKLISGRLIRLRSAENVFEEWERYYLRYGTTGFYCVDDFFTHDAARIKKLCNMILEKRYPFIWRAQTRADAVSEPGLLELMKKAGCEYISLGIESGDPSVLKTINKRLDLDVAEKTIASAQRIGMKVTIFLMVGLPGQNWESIEKTADFIRKTKPFRVSVKIYIPFDDSPITSNLDFYGIELLPEARTLSNKMIHDDFIASNSLKSREKNIRPIHRTREMSPEEIYLARWYLDAVYKSSMLEDSHADTDPQISKQRKWRSLADWFVMRFLNDIKTEKDYQAMVGLIMMLINKSPVEERDIFIKYLWDGLLAYAEEIPMPSSIDNARVLAWDPNWVNAIGIYPVREGNSMKVYKTMSGKPTNVFRALRELGINSRHLNHLSTKEARLDVLIDPSRKADLVTSPLLDRQDFEQNSTQKLLSTLDNMPENSIFVFGGSLPENISIENLEDIFEHAKKNKIFIVVDFSLRLTKEQALTILKNSPNLIKPNLKEFEMLCRYAGLIGDDYRLNCNNHAGIVEIRDYAKIICDKFNIPSVIVTLAEKGAILHSSDKSYYGYSMVSQEEIMGLLSAGDAFCAGVIVGLLEGQTLEIKKINWEKVLSKGLKVASAKVQLSGLTMPSNDVAEKQKISLVSIGGDNGTQSLLLGLASEGAITEVATEPQAAELLTAKNIRTNL